MLEPEHEHVIGTGFGSILSCYNPKPSGSFLEGPISIRLGWYLEVQLASVSGSGNKAE